jgi:hypothetical protein
MSKAKLTILSAAGLLVSAGLAFAQPMNNSGTNVPDGHDKTFNDDSHLPIDKQQPDTRDSVAKKADFGARQQRGLAEHNLELNGSATRDQEGIVDRARGSDR